MKFPGDGMVKTLHFQCPGPRFNPWSGNYDPTAPRQKNKTNNQIKNHPKQKQQQKHSCFLWKPGLIKKFIPDLSNRNRCREINRNNGSKGEIKRKNKAGFFFFFFLVWNVGIESESHSRFPVLGGGWRYAGCQRNGPSCPLQFSSTGSIMRETALLFWSASIQSTLNIRNGPHIQHPKLHRWGWQQCMSHRDPQSGRGEHSTSCRATQGLHLGAEWISRTYRRQALWQ